MIKYNFRKGGKQSCCNLTKNAITWWMDLENHKNCWIVGAVSEGWPGCSWMCHPLSLYQSFHWCKVWLFGGWKMTYGITMSALVCVHTGIDHNLLCCDAMWSCRWLLMFLRNVGNEVQDHTVFESRRPCLHLHNHENLWYLTKTEFSILMTDFKPDGKTDKMEWCICIQL